MYKISTMKNIGKGYLTYTMGFIAVAFGVLGLIMGWIDEPSAMVIIWSGLTTLGVRRAIKNGQSN